MTKSFKEAEEAYQNKSYKEAFDILVTLTESNNDVDAQYLLGMLYLRGDGVPEDFVIAHMWFNLAASKGNEDARISKNNICTSMTCEQVAEAQKMAREQYESVREKDRKISESKHSTYQCDKDDDKDDSDSDTYRRSNHRDDWKRRPHLGSKTGFTPPSPKGFTDVRKRTPIESIYEGKS